MALTSSEQKVKDLLDKNGLWKQVWSMILGTVILGIPTSLALAWPVAWMWNHSVDHLIVGVFPMSFWEAFCFVYMLRLMKPVRYNRR